MESRDANKHTQQQQRSPRKLICIYAQRDEGFYRELQSHLVLWHEKGYIRWLELSAGAMERL